MRPCPTRRWAPGQPQEEERPEPLADLGAAGDEDDRVVDVALDHEFARVEEGLHAAHDVRGSPAPDQGRGDAAKHDGVEADVPIALGLRDAERLLELMDRERVEGVFKVGDHERDVAPEAPGLEQEDAVCENVAKPRKNDALVALDEAVDGAPPEVHHEADILRSVAPDLDDAGEL